jgi:FkbM family methyltransferase
VNVRAESMFVTKSTVKQRILCLPAPIPALLRWCAVSPVQKYFRYVPWAFGKRLLWEHVVSHLWWLEAIAVARLSFGGSVLVDAQDTCGRYLYYFGTWEPNLTQWIRQRLQDGDVFVDVGANVGYYTLLASRLVGAGRVVALEPCPRAFRMLRQSLARNKAENVRIVNVAAWHESSVLKMFSGVELGMSTLMENWAARWDSPEYCDVPAARLPEILTSEEIAAARIIKIDVEGAEWHVIQGMAGVLDRCREDLEIVVEVTPAVLAAEGTSGGELLAFFARRGYRPYLLENDYSPRSYYAGGVLRPPYPITEFPTEGYQHDIIFSRR